MSLQSEVLAVEAAGRAAQARLGLAAAYLSLLAWQTVNIQNAAATGAAWVGQSVRIIYAVRQKSSRLAKAQYQLVRALETGYTLGQPDYTDGVVTLAGLREQFQAAVLEVATLNTEAGSTDDPDEQWFESELRRADVSGVDVNARSDRLSDTELDKYIQDLLDATPDDDRDIRVDRFQWQGGLSPDATERAFAEMIEKAAVTALAEKARRLSSRGETDPNALLRRLTKEYDSKGSVGAGYVDWAGVSAGREDIAYAVKRDRRVVKVARGLGPNPCAWCSMLASRGFVYASKESAGFNAFGRSEWHRNCHCYPIVRFSTRTDGSLPAINLYFEQKWEEVTKGKSGQAARTEWRRWVEKRQNGRKPGRPRKTPAS